MTDQPLSGPSPKMDLQAITDRDNCLRDTSTMLLCVSLSFLFCFKNLAKDIGLDSTRQCLDWNLKHSSFLGKSCLLNFSMQYCSQSGVCVSMSVENDADRQLYKAVLTIYFFWVAIVFLRRRKKLEIGNGGLEGALLQDSIV